MKRLPEKPPDPSQLPDVKDVVARYYNDNEFKHVVDSNNRRYLYWDELQYRVPDPEERIQTWTAMKAIRAQISVPVHYPLINMEVCSTPFILKSLHQFDRYLSGTIQIQDKPLRIDKRYIISSLIEEAIASSILEGAVTTRQKAREMIEQKKKPKNHGEQMVLNNYQTLQMIIRKKGEPLTPDLLCELQRMVTQDTIDSQDVGLFRDRDDVTVMDASSGVICHIPPKHEEINRLILALCEYANIDDEERFVHPIIKGIIIHFLIGFIHPFNDGNGRTARSLFYWYTLSRGYWFMEYLSISRSILKSKRRYGLSYLYTEYDQMDLTYFIHYHIACMNEALEDLIHYIGEKEGQKGKSRDILLTDPQITPRQAEILSEMMDANDQIFTIYQIAERFNVVYQTARTDLLRLEELGYIVREKRGKGLFFYYREG